MRSHLLRIVACSAFLLLPTIGLTQFPGGDDATKYGRGKRDRGSFGDTSAFQFQRGNGANPFQPGGSPGAPTVTGAPGGFSGRSMMMMGGDPNDTWNRFANGKDVLRKEDMPPQMQGFADRMIERMGGSNGQVTKQQFLDFSAKMRQGMGMTPGASADGKPVVMTTSADAMGSMANPGDMMTNWAESSFRRMDANGDGLLNYDEMPEALKAEREKWDTNQDGFIDLNEYKAYFTARMRQMAMERGMGSAGGGIQDDATDEEDRRAKVHRAGKLPKELPAWFAPMDTDRDGQIGLYEWKNSGRSIGEFLAMDRNGDGFLTVDEVLFAENKKRGATGESLADAGSDVGGFRGGRGGMPGAGFGGMPGGNFGATPGVGFGGTPGGFGTTPGGGFNGMQPGGFTGDRSGRGGPGRGGRGGDNAGGAWGKQGASPDGNPFSRRTAAPDGTDKGGKGKGKSRQFQE